jgi:catechol 2,3-dioxygenase-like lactoylglutathione lyase family enzyme
MVGISIYPDHFSGFENYEFIAGYQVSSVDHVPEGMTVRTFPARQYAVVTHKGTINSLADSYGYFHSKWLPASGYEYASHYDIQIYSSRFLGADDPDSELDVYIPIRPSQKEALVHASSPIRGEIQGVFIPVRDVHEAKAWYSRILGLSESSEVVNGHLYVLPIDGPNIILDEMPMWRGSESGGPPPYQTPAFTLTTDSIEEAYKFMQNQGVHLVTEIMDEQWFVFRDPYGNMLMICEA